jgi:mannitol-1-/sugar-/sorbitol-6-phosphatase
VSRDDRSGQLNTLAAQGLLLDMDGVLVDSTGAVERHWARWAERRGVSFDEVMRYGQGSTSREVVARFVPAEEVAAEADWVEKLVLEPALELALPGALAALTQSWLPVAVVTSATRQSAEVRFERAGLPMPAILVAADDVTRGKPDPEPYLRGAALLGLPAKACVGVDDTAAGLASIRAAGAAPFGLTTTYPAERLSAAIATFPDLSSLHISQSGVTW